MRQAAPYVKKFVKQILYYARAWEKSRTQTRVARILSQSQPPDCGYAERAFEKLQNAYPSYQAYGYDLVSLWQRAANRSLTLLGLEGMENPGKRVLEVGAGDGMLGVALKAVGHNVELIDQEDWRHAQALGVPLTLADCCNGLPFASDSFDLSCSYNSFEHFSNPEKVFSEMLRVTKPGGWIYIEFGPLYCSPWGLHAYRALRMPYPQFLFSAEFVSRKLKEIGIWDLGKKRTELQYLNQWKPRQFEELWRHAEVEVTQNIRHANDSELSLVERYPWSFCGRNLSLEDLTVAAIYVTAKKR